MGRKNLVRDSVSKRTHRARNLCLGGTKGKGGCQGKSVFHQEGNSITKKEVIRSHVSGGRVLTVGGTSQSHAANLGWAKERNWKLKYSKAKKNDRKTKKRIKMTRSSTGDKADFPAHRT